MCGEYAVSNKQNIKTITRRANSTDVSFQGSPTIVRHREFLYIFFINSDKTIKYVYSKMPLASSNGEFGSCNSGTDHFGSSSCLSWSSVYVVPGINNAQTITSISLNPSGIDKLMLVYTREISGGNYYLEFKLANSVNATTGDITWPTTSGFLNWLTDAAELEVTWMKVDPAVFSNDKLIGLFFINKTSSSTFEWFSFNPSLLQWNYQGGIKDEQNNFIQGDFAPALVLWPHITLSNARTCGVFPSLKISSSDPWRNGKAIMRFYCYNISTNRWKISNIAEYLTDKKPSIVYHRARAWDGKLINNDLSLGYFGIAFEAGKKIYTLRSESLDINKSPELLNFPRTKTSLVFIYNKHINSADGIFTLFEDEETAAFKGVFISTDIQYIPDTETANAYIDQLNFYPFVDETFRVVLQTENDFRMMERYICWGLHIYNFTDPSHPETQKANDFCGASFQRKWGY